VSRRAAGLRAAGCLVLLASLRGSAWWAADRGEADLAPDYRPVVRDTDLDRAEPVTRAAPGTSGEFDGPPARWLVLCWDGASWNVILPMIEQGRLPHLARLMAGGAYGNLLTIKPTLSPIVWTTVATGVPPSRHGVIGLQKGHAEGTHADPGSALYDNADRRVKAVWNILTEHGRSVAVVGYHATFPVEPVAGVMVSNYAIRRQHAFGYQAPEESAALRSYMVHPPELASEVLSVERRLQDVSWKEVRRFANVSAAEFRTRTESVGPLEVAQDRWSYLIKSYLYDSFHGEVGLRFWERLRPTLGVVHFQSPDWAAHRYLYFHWPERFLSIDPRRTLPQDAPVYQPTLPAFYEFVDEWLGRFLRERDRDTAVMVLSDHGVEPVPDEPNGGHEEAPPGILVMSGPGVRPGRIQGATVYDILPTLVASLGLPLADDLEGRAVGLREDALARGGRTVPTYGPYRHPRPVPAGPGLERALTEELKALGYIH
jgi:hypothetical protein